MSFLKSTPAIPEIYGSRSEIGLVRGHNEDNFAAISPLFVVADGMGGHEAGEVASAIAVETMLSAIPQKTDPQALSQAVVDANLAVIQAAADGRGKPGMGTTLTAATIFGDELVIAQVGDSRAYLLHDGALQRLTRDHSLVAELVHQGRITEEEARYHPQRSVITRALGSDPGMHPDIYSLNLSRGDKLMLCSDGLYSMVDDEQIAEVMRRESNPQACCDALVNDAISAGGLDNVTVIVVDPFARAGEDRSLPLPAYGGQDAGGAPGGSVPAAGASEAAQAPAAAAGAKKSHRGPILGAVAVLVVLALAVGGIFLYAQNSWFLISENDTVVLYKGLPGQIGPLRLAWVEEQTDIQTSKLASSTAERLDEGISVNTREEADDLLSSYRKTVEASKSSPAQQSDKDKQADDKQGQQ